MLSKESQKKVLQLLKVPEADIATMVDPDEEVEATIPDGVKVFDAVTYASLETNLKNTGKTAHINAGKEIAIKDLKEKEGLDYEGKDIDTFLLKLNEKYANAAKVPPSEAMKLKDQQILTLQENLKSANQAAEAERQTAASVKQEREWLKAMPEDRNKNMSDEDRLILLKSKMQVEDVDGKPVYKYKGQVVAGEDTNPLELDGAMKVVFADMNWVGADPAQPNTPVGRGEHSQRNNNSGKPMKLSEAESQWEKDGKQAGGADFQAHVTQLKKENPSFDLNA